MALAVLRAGDRLPELTLPSLAAESGAPAGDVVVRDLPREGRPVLLVFLRWLG
jgi:hypothetical protein